MKKTMQKSYDTRLARILKRFRHASRVMYHHLFGWVMRTSLVITIAGSVGWSMASDMQTVSYAQAELIDFEETVTQTVEETQNAVVSVANYQTITTDQSAMFEPGVGLGYGSQGQGLQIEDIEQDPVLAGSGSGVIYKVEGDRAYVVTNNHVVEDADALEVTLVDGTVVEASLIGADSYSDLAVLAIPSENVTDTISFADSDNIQVGSIAIAIGSPLDSALFSTSVTQGIVSGLNRSVPTDSDGDGVEDWEMTLLQTDAAINPGNSGGAVVNTSGQLIGISSSKIASEDVEGIGFAIPSNDVAMIVEQLESTGSVVRPKLGISMVDVSNFTSQTRVQDLGLSEETTQGVVVAEVANGSAAEVAGLVQYDVITEIDGEAIEDGLALRQRVFNHSVGDTVTLTVIRQGQILSLSVELTESLN